MSRRAPSSSSSRHHRNLSCGSRPSETRTAIWKPSRSPLSAKISPLIGNSRTSANGVCAGSNPTTSLKLGGQECPLLRLRRRDGPPSPLNRPSVVVGLLLAGRTRCLSHVPPLCKITARVVFRRLQQALRMAATVKWPVISRISRNTPFSPTRRACHTASVSTVQARSRSNGSSGCLSRYVTCPEVCLLLTTGPWRRRAAGFT